MEVSSQTYRLADIMKQVNANLMEELVTKEKMHNERLNLKMARKSPYNSPSLKKRNKETESWMESEEKLKQQKKLGNVWSAARSFRKITDKDADFMNKSKTLDKTAVGPTKFMKAAKIAIMINQVREDRGMCTCYSLDSKCSLHDS